MLHVKPWELLGFVYETVEDAPICWREWAFEFVTAKAAAQEHRAARMFHN